MSSNKPPPWKTPKPKGKGSKLTPEERFEAERRAREAGRPYPNLIDNMAVLRKRKDQ